MVGFYSLLSSLILSNLKHELLNRLRSTMAANVLIKHVICPQILGRFMNSELKRMCKEAVMLRFKLLSQRKKTQKPSKHERLGDEPGNYKIRIT
jgi:hypothetical protein